MSTIFDVQDNQMLDTPETAQLIGTTDHTLIRWRRDVAAGRPNPGPPFYKLGAAIRYKGADLKAWANGSRMGADQPATEVAA